MLVGGLAIQASTLHCPLELSILTRDRSLTTSKGKAI